MIPVAVLHERAAGWISSMAEFKTIDQLSEFRGLRDLDLLPSYKAFQALNLSARLRLSNVNDFPPGVHAVLVDLVEYSVLEWLSSSEMNFGYTDRGMIYLIGGAIGFTTQGSTGQSVPVARIDSEPNQLLAARPISLALPPGSTVVRSGTEDRTIEIKTKHSYIRLRIALQGGVPFQPADPLGRHIISLLKLANTSSLWVHAFAIELDTGQ